MSDATPRVGVIGLGSIGRTHINAWKANGITPVAFADAVPAALEKVQAEHGGETFDDGVKLIQSGLIDIVSICTPPLFHKDLAIAATEAGVAVICEKPLARTLADAEAITEAVERSGILFTVGFCHRFQPEIEKLKAMIDGGELGTIMTFRNRFAGLKADAHTTWFGNPAIAGGGVLADTNVHSIDLFRFLIGEPEGIHAFLSTRETEHGPKLEVDDTAVLTVKTADGTLGIIESSWRTPPGEWTVTVYGTQGTAVVDYKDTTLRVQGTDGEWRQVEVEDGSRFDREFAHFLACWRGEAQPRVTVRDGLAANRILDAAYASDPMVSVVG
ncbi:MAG TPA: Gfo/Idh/MocA family oxidoreductase [Thermomicrobiales bacterium]|nr:Gfo/Idh/MocA family oxidoreductase [Thermomicrobiales bacterium]